MLFDLTIPKKQDLEAALDHEQLYAIGIERVQQLASRIWTDYNVHDPGVTTLEILCYALTDLGYRASFPVEDLLASPTDNANEMQKQFFAARRILPNRPLTLSDYRKLLIDLAGVKNAWLKPAAVDYYADIVEGKLLGKNPGVPGIVKVTLAGLYDVIVEYMDDMATAAAKQNVMKNVKQRLHANRNLGEDFFGFSEVETQPFILCAELELAADADLAEVQAKILFQVQAYLAPAVANYTLAEMLDRKKPDGTAYTAAEIFDGPALDCGFIDDGELAEADLRAEIRLSDVISIVMDIEGVQAVRDIVINPEGTKSGLENKWIVPVEPGKKALLNREKSRLVLYKRNMPVVAAASEVKKRYDALVQAARVKAETKAAYDFAIPLGKYRKPASYYSFQNHFPALYGLSEVGLSGGADEKRRALAFQFKAYLLFFDQVMANYFAQLSHVGELFSTDPQMRQTYFYQVVDSFADHAKIYGAADAVQALRNVGETQATQIDRRNRFLDHLIARFAERFNDFVNVMVSAFGSTAAAMTAYRCEFLSHYPAISSERALAYNYTLKGSGDLWDSENVSGLEKRLARLLGIRNFARRNLGDIAFDASAEIDGNAADGFLFRIRKKDSGEILLSGSGKHATAELAKKEMQRAIRLALLPAGYERKVATNGTHFFNIVAENGEIVARRIEFFATEEEMNRAIEELMEYLRLNYGDEGMYLIENILLRPAQNNDPFLPICPDPNCADCAEADPYSYRIHIILPAYSSRFSNMDFRRYAEEVIRSETPAHILAKICWIGAEDMVVFEKAYRDWIDLKAGANAAQRAQKLKVFIDILFKVKSVYPVQKLYECASGEDKAKFILGQSSLGTMKQNDE